MNEQAFQKACEEFIFYTGVIPFDGLSTNNKIPEKNPFTQNNMLPPEKRTWESLEEVRERALRALKRYKHLSTVIVVSHAVLIASIIGVQRYIKHAEIVPFTLDLNEVAKPTQLVKVHTR